MELTELKPWHDGNIYHVKTSEFKNRNLSDFARKQKYKRNVMPCLTQDESYWTFIKVLKSSTNVVHWLIKVDNRFIVVAQFNMYQIGDVTAFYESNSKGQYDNLNPITIYKSYIDIKSSCDRFMNEYIAVLINEKDVRLQNILEL